MKARLTYILICLVCLAVSARAQQKKYSVANGHSHNDYAHPVPFHTAYNVGFGSIEADVFLRDTALYVAHDAVDIRPERTLIALYLEPLLQAIRKDNCRQLILLIDLKTAAEPTLDVLLRILSRYPALTSCNNLQIVVSGNRPPISKWLSYPSWLYFDGRFNEHYDPDFLSKVAMLSASFRSYTSWQGEGAPPQEDIKKINAAVKRAQELNKLTRFWATPDNENTWRLLMQLNVDFINTDKIKELAEFFSSKRN